MRHETVLVGPLTRDLTRFEGGGAGGPWRQPGGAVWHAGLALSLAAPAADASVTTVASAGPWARRYGLPGLAAAGVHRRGQDGEHETSFINRYEAGRRQQRLLSTGVPVSAAALAGLQPQAAVVSPLMPGDTPPEAGALLARSGAFVALDAQGLLRVRVDGGRIATRPAGLGPSLSGVRALKFSEREFRVQVGLPDGADWREAARAQADVLGVELVVTRGARGASVALPGQRALIEIGGTPVEASVDTTGAGDMLIASYGRARSHGLAPAAALERGVGETQTVLRRRMTAHGATGGALPALLEALQLLAAGVRWRERQGHPCAASFLPERGFVRDLMGHLPERLHGAATAAGRAESVVGACFALVATGWPDDPRLDVAAWRALLAEERRRLP